MAASVQKLISPMMLARRASHMTKWVSISTTMSPVIHCQQCRQRYTINRPMKPKPEPICPLYEDPALHVVPEREEYAEIWFHIRGYDVAPVESYTKFLRRFLRDLDSKLACVVIPPRKWTVHTFKPRTELEDHEYQFKRSHRVIQVKGLANNIAALVLDLVTTYLPPGVQLKLTAPDEDLIEFRFVPDADINALQSELDALNEGDA